MSGLMQFRKSWVAVCLLLLLAACDSIEERVEKHYEAGEKLFEEGKLEKALVEYKSAISLDPQHVASRYQLGRIQELQQKHSNAITEYLRVIEIQPSNALARIRASNILILAGELERAEEHIDEAAKVSPDDLELLLIRSLLRVRQSRFDEAEVDAKAALKKNPASARGGLVLALVEQSRAGDRAALVVVDQFLEVNQRDVSLNILKIRLLNELEDKPAIREHLNHMTRLYPNSMQMRQMLARWYVSQDFFDDAENEFRRLVDLQPGEPKPVRDLINLVREVRGEDAALEETAKQIEKAPTAVARRNLQILLSENEYNAGNTARAYKILDEVFASTSVPENLISANLLYSQFKGREKDFEESLVYANKVLDADEKNAIALGLRAAVYSEQGKSEESVLAIRSALNESPQNFRLRRLAAKIYERNGNDDLTNESFATAVLLSKYRPLIVREYISFLRRQNQYRAIESVLSETVRVHGEERELIAALAATRLRLQDWAGAERAAARLRLAENAETDAERVRAAVLIGQKRYGESIQLMQRLAEEGDADGSIMAALIEVYVKAGQTGQARAYIDKVLEDDAANARALRLSGALYQLSDEQDKAEQEFRNSILASPLDPVGYIVLGRFLKSAGDLEQAEQITRSGIANAPESSVLHIQLADLLLIKGDVEGAILEFEVVYDIQPNSLTAANNLASMLADFHADTPSLVDRAFGIAARLAESKNPAHMDTYGWILYLRGEYAAALRSLAPAAEQLRNNPWVQYHAGMVYSKLNRVEDARRHLQAALDSGGTHMFPLREQALAALEELPPPAQSGG